MATIISPQQITEEQLIHLAFLDYMQDGALTVTVTGGLYHYTLDVAALSLSKQSKLTINLSNTTELYDAYGDAGRVKINKNRVEFSKLDDGPLLNFYLDTNNHPDIGVVELKNQKFKDEFAVFTPIGQIIPEFCVPSFLMFGAVFLLTYFRRRA